MSLNRWLRVVILTGIFLAPTIPFFVSSLFFFPFITGKNFAFRLLVEIVCAAWLILMLRDPSFRPRFSWLFPVIGFFLATLAVSTIVSVEPLKSFWSNFERMEGYVTLLHLAAYFTVLASVMTTTLWKRFFEVSVGASVIMGFIGLFQLGGALEIHQGGVRLDATMGNATYLAVYMLFHIFFALLLLARSWNSMAARFIYPAIILLQTVILYYTATRGAILGLVGGLIIAAAAIALFEREQRAMRRGAIGLLLAIAVLLGGFFALKDTTFIEESPVLSRFASISLEETTSKSRLIIYTMAWQGFLERPLFGWGQESFNYVFNTHYDPGMYAQEQWFDRAHNQFLDWLIAGGLFGFIAYLLLFIVALLILARAGGKITVTERALTLGLLAGYAFNNLFVFDNIVSSLYFFTVLAYLHYLGRRDAPALGFLSSIPEKVRDRIVVPGVVLATLVAIYVVQVPPVTSAAQLLSAIAPDQQGVAHNLVNFKEVIARGGVGKQEAVEQLMQTAVSVARNQNIDLAVKSDFVQTAYDTTLALIAEHPENARLEVFMGSFLNSLGRWSDAIPYLERALALSPGKQGIIFELAAAKLNVGNTEEALELFRKAFELEPNFRTARILYAVGAIYAGEPTLAKQVLEEGFGTMVVEDERLAKAYFDTEQFDLVIAIRRATLERDQNALQPRVQIAAALLAKGDRAGAIAELEEAITRNPSFKEQGEFFINEIKAGRNP